MKNRGRYTIWFTSLKAIPECMVTNGDIQACDKYVDDRYRYMIWSTGMLEAYGLLWWSWIIAIYMNGWWLNECMMFYIDNRDMRMHDGL